MNDIFTVVSIVRIFFPIFLAAGIFFVFYVYAKNKGLVGRFTQYAASIFLVIGNIFIIDFFIRYLPYIFSNSNEMLIDSFSALTYTLFQVLPLSVALLLLSTELVRHETNIQKNLGLLSFIPPLVLLLGWSFLWIRIINFEA